MSQILNLEISAGKSGILLNVYFHWNGFTGGSMEITNLVWDKIEENPEIKVKLNNYLEEKTDFSKVELTKLLVNAIRDALNGEPMLDEESKKVLGVIDSEMANRNDGIISVTEEGILKTREWAEGISAIDIVNNTCYFSVGCYHYISDDDEDGDVFEDLGIEEDEDGYYTIQDNEKVYIANTNIDFMYPMNREEFLQLTKDYENSKSLFLIHDNDIFMFID